MTLNASMSTDVVQRVLFIPEIQDNIFSFNKVGDAFRCSLVCKSWLPVALDHIWHTVPSLRPLFNFLAPVIARRKGNYKVFNFKRSITDKDRARFSSIIAWRVKYLETSSRHEEPCKSALFEFSKLRSEATGSTLPNLKGLTIHVHREMKSMDMAALFLHSRLEILSIIQANKLSKSRSELKAFLDEVTLRSPSLRVLTVHITIRSVRKVVAQLMRLLSVQQSLITLIVPPGTLTGPVLECLSRLQTLRRISMGELIEDVDLSLLRTLPCTWADDSDRFPSLRFLVLHAQLKTAEAFISSHPSFSRLVELEIEMIFGNDAKDIRRFLEIISDTCRGLEILRLAQFRGGEDDELAGLDVITKDTLISIVSLRELWDFSLTHAQPVQMTDDELVDFLGSCPKLAGFELSPCPRVLPSDISLLPSLSVMHRLVPVQPKLECLSMCFNGLNCNLVDSDSADVIIVPLESLQSLNVGHTRISESDGIARYLSQLLPLDCELTFGAVDEEMEKLWSEVQAKLDARSLAA